jgi:hypothetical protein
MGGKWSGRVDPGRPGLRQRAQTPAKRLSLNPWEMVGASGFEPPTSWSRSCESQICRGTRYSCQSSVCDRVELHDRFRGKLQRRGLEIFAKMFDRRCAGDQQNIGRAMEQPCGRDLHWRRADGRSNYVQIRRLQRMNPPSGKNGTYATPCVERSSTKASSSRWAILKKFCTQTTYIPLTSE